LDDAMPRRRDFYDVFKGGVMLRIEYGVLCRAQAFGIALAVIAVLAVRFMPAPYESEAVVSTQSVYFLERPVTDEMKIVTERAFNEDKLAAVVETLNLYPDSRVKGGTEKAIQRVREGMRVSTQFPRGSFVLTSISFRHPDPVIAKSVTIALVTNFIDETIRLQSAEQFAAAVAAEGKVRTGNIGSYKMFPRAPGQLLSAATEGHHPDRPKLTTVGGLALAEGSQIGLIIALLRRRTLPPRLEMQPASI